MSDRPIGYALVGASGFGDYCLSHYREMDCLRPVGVWNRTAEKAAGLAARWGIRHYSSMEQLLADPRVDLVHVATVPSLHARQAVSALEAGKHVLVEKPLATTEEDARRIVDLAREKDLRVSVNFMMRYGKLAGVVRSIIAEGLLGDFLRGQLFNCAGDEGLVDGHWFWDPASSGGIFVEHGVHFFDLAAYWLGEGKVVSAGRSGRPGSRVVDQVFCTSGYGSQASVCYYHGFHQASVLDRQEFKLIFELGEVVLTGWVADGILIRALSGERCAARLQELLPGADIKVSRRIEGGTVRCRWKERPCDRLIEMSWKDERSRDGVYGAALKELMADLVRGLRARSHRPLVTGQEGLSALIMALTAGKLAEADES